MLRKTRTAASLTPGDRRCAIAAILLSGLVRVALWTLPFRWIKRVVESSASSRPLAGKFTSRQVSWAVRLASRYVPRATCLTQAVTAQTLLNWSGLKSSLHIGVAREPKFAAHAWVEHEGRILIGGAEESELYSPILSLEPGSRQAMKQSC